MNYLMDKLAISEPRFICHPGRNKWNMPVNYFLIMPGYVLPNFCAFIVDVLILCMCLCNTFFVIGNVDATDTCPNIRCISSFSRM